MSRLSTLIKRYVPVLLGLCLVLGTGTAAAVERVTYYHNDTLGSPVAATDAGGLLLWREAYQPYGQRIRREAGSGDTAWYTGKQEEAATGLVYYGARWYDPSLGRFTSRDPVGFDAGNPVSFSRYAYANDNPYLYVDPDGNSATIALEAGLSAAEGGTLVCGPVCGAVAGITTGITVWLAADALYGAYNEGVGDAADGGSRISDREPGPDGKSGSTGGPGAGKRFKPESPEEKASNDGVPCRYCGVETTNTPGKPNSRERDHIDPKSKGGNNSPENEGNSCRTCNRSKGARNPEQWRQK